MSFGSYENLGQVLKEYQICQQKLTLLNSLRSPQNPFAIINLELE